MQVFKIKNMRVFALCLLALIVIPLSFQFDIDSLSPKNTPQENIINLDEIQSIDTVPEESIFVNDNERWIPSATEHAPPISEGIIDPILVEQSGYSTTGDISARTDTMVNTEQSLTFDTDHDWVVSSAQVEVTNLETLYVVNGSFDEGNPGYTEYPNGTLTNYPLGWSAVSNNTDPVAEQVQQVSYEDNNGESFVLVQNIGPETNTGQNWYTHYNGTYVLWNQTIAITPYTEDFLLNFDFLYLKGPIWSALEGNFSIQVFVDGVSVWRQDLPTLSERGIWYNSGTIPVNITISSETTMFMIGLVIDDTFYVDADEDYSDADDTPDGIVNCEYITVLLDDISFIGATPPSCEAVDLQFIIDSVPTPIFGALGTGYGIIENPMNWRTSPISFSIVSNTSISLDYSTVLLNHRYLNSTPTTNTLQEGVAYSIASGQSGNLEMYTYLGFIGVYENLTIKIYHPVDWQNFTVYDPFLVDVTSSCSDFIEYIEVPTSLLIDRLGWWKVTCDIFNYASNASIQRYDVGTTDWLDESIFHTDEKARLSVSIGATTQIPLLSDAVNFTWFLPNCTIWSESSIVSGVLETADSNSITFGATNTTAGIWGVSYLWSNSSEIAYGCVEFALHHQATLEVVFENELNTVVGDPVTVWMRFFDVENGLLLINDGAIVTSTWAGGTVDFTPDIVKNWWQAEFDTALVGAGNFEVIVNSSAPFFETAPVIITIKSQYLTDLDSPAGPLEPLIYGRSYDFDFFYSQSYDGLGINNALVEITEDGSEWASVSDNGDGNYTLTLTPLGERDYSIRIRFSKIGYANQSFVLSFLVEQVPMDVELISGLSGDEFLPFDIEVAIREIGTNDPVLDANVTLSVITSAGIVHTLQTMNEQDNGHYTANFTMPSAGAITYRLIIQVAKDHYELEQDFQDTLVPIVNTSARLFQTVIDNSFLIVFAASVLIAVVAGRSRNKRRRAAAREIEIRFDDADNILGIIVLHKLSGIPIYSKILKGGFEEGMLSAFITAIMHFRSEFDTSEDSDEYRILPISDIIRAIPTPNLVCAFITISSASSEQEAKMVGYARAIGMMLDETLAERPTQVADAKTVKTFEWFFDDFVDGGLLRRYQIGIKSLPRRFKRLDDILLGITRNGTFSLKNMVKALEESGESEDDAYLLTMKAVEKELILPVYPFNGNDNGAPEAKDS
ncbi:MAG: hypothetical protein RTU63_07125 [Candidatus Thorarchaeota archaeon]